jgi:GDP-L-fucose synthase
MKRVLVTGGNGYIAKSLVSGISCCDLTCITRKDLDLHDDWSVRRWFADKHFDVVVHTASVGGSRLREDDDKTSSINERMFYNLVDNRDRFGKLISFGSGAEFSNPQTPYGKSKSTISKYIDTVDSWNNLRIYAVFDANELPTRFIKANLIRYMQKEPMQIDRNKYMDFFYMGDLVSLVKQYIERDDQPKTIDCVYGQKYTLMQIANFINSLGTYRVPIVCKHDGIASPYCGFANMGGSYIGLYEGIRRTYDKLWSSIH